MTKSEAQRIVIVGGVAGGMSAATRLRRLDERAEITVFEKSNFVSYANCGLPYYLGGVIEWHDSLVLQTPEGLKAQFNLDVHVKHEVISINRASKTVTVKNLNDDSEFEVPYDKLILSPGATPIRPPIPGIEKTYQLRTVEDVDTLFAAIAHHPSHVTVVGGGYIGVETAENLQHRGIKTTLVEAAPQVFAPIDEEMALTVADVLQINGVEVRLNTSLTEVKDDAVVLSDGSEIKTELVVLAIGVRPDTKLAVAADLEIGERGGIKVNEFHQTSDSDIYAVGDACEKKDALDSSAVLIPLANLANRHGRVTADHICGHPVRPTKSTGTSIVKVFDLAVAATGWNERRLKAAGIKFAAIHTHPGSHAGYYPGTEQMMLKLLFDPETGQILGAQGIGGEGIDKRIDVLATAMQAGMKANQLMDLELAYAPPFSSAKDPVNMLGYIADNLMTGAVSTIQWHELAGELAAGALLVDVRSAYEFGRGHIEGAINIPLPELRDRHTEINSKKLIVMCASGHRSNTGSRLLMQLGFEARNLDGGYATWKSSPAAI
jgi:NADPH-dependent 2,4-dienoyl-CoA reductase/sulfur reductase-like enzyme/rhodanese-related sulfurtransferase